MARLFHRLTSYRPEGREVLWSSPADDPWIVTSFRPNDLDGQPPLAKEFPAELPRLALPHELPSPRAGTLAVLAGQAERGTKLGLAQLARLLPPLGRDRPYRDAPRRSESFPSGRQARRGARFPQEVYVAVPEGSADLPPGVHAYQPVEHTLAQVAAPPSGEAPAFIVTGVPWRTGWRYRERGYRHIFWDGGTMLSQMLALSASAGLPARLYTEFPDIEVRDLVGANGIDEFPIAVLTLGDGKPGWSPSERGSTGSVADDPVHFPLVTATHWAGVSTSWRAPWPTGDQLPRPLPDSPPVNDVIYQRGSTRRMDASRSVPRFFLEAALGVALRGIDLPNFVAVHAVDGLAPVCTAGPTSRDRSGRETSASSWNGSRSRKASPATPRSSSSRQPT